jgi:hypothetical protein
MKAKPEKQQTLWLWGGMVAVAVLLAAIATATLVHGGIDTVMSTVAAIASVVGIGAIFRWAVLRERTRSPDKDQ